MTSEHDTLSVGMVGYAFMGAAHSQAWRNAPRFFDLPLRPRHGRRGRPRRRPRSPRPPPQLGWESTETDWQALVARDDIDLVDVCTPGDTHAEIAIAALEAGKHVLCEKPLANTVEEAEAMVAAAEKAAAHGVRSMVGFTYRRVPAIALARQLVAEGRLGTIHHVRAQYLQDWIVDPEAPLSWRLDKAKAGSGALGDIGAHIVDLTQFITGDTIADGHRAAGDLRQGAPAAGGVPHRAVRHRRRDRARRRSPSTTRPRSSPTSAAARWASSRRPASPTAARTPSASRSTARAAAWPSTSRT